MFCTLCPLTLEFSLNYTKLATLAIKAYVGTRKNEFGKKRPGTLRP